MRNILYYVILMPLLLWQSCNAQETYRVDGRIEGFAEGSQVSLTLAATHKDEKPEVAAVTNGAFSFTGKVEGPRLYLLTVTEPSGCSGARMFMLENAEIKIVASKGKQLAAEYVDFDKFEVEGSASDKVFREKMAFRDELDRQYNAMHEKYRKVETQMDEARRKGDEGAIQRLQSSEDYKAFLEADGQFFHLVERTMYEEFRRNGDTFWGPLLVLSNMSYIPPTDTTLATIYKGFSEEAKNSFYGKILGKELTVNSLNGQNLPGFALPDRDGKFWESQELIRGKKLVLIDFWASWCLPCRKSIPVLKEIYKAYKNEGLEIVSISIDKNEADWRKALDEEQFPWPALLDTQGVFSEKFNGKAIPMFVLVDENGVVIDDTVTIQNLSQRIEEIL